MSKPFPYSLTDIASRIVEKLKRKLNSTSSSQTISKAVVSMADLSSVCQMPVQNTPLDNSDLRELLIQCNKKASVPDTESAVRHIRNTADDHEVRALIACTATRLRKEAEAACKTMLKQMEEYDEAALIRESSKILKGVTLKKKYPKGLTEYEKKYAEILNEAIEELNNRHDKNSVSSLRSQIEHYGHEVAFLPRRHNAPWNESAEEYWRTAKEDFATQRGEDAAITSDFSQTVDKTIAEIESIRNRYFDTPKGFKSISDLHSWMKDPTFYNKPYHSILKSITTPEDAVIDPRVCIKLVRAKRDFDASVDTGEIYGIFMRLFSALTLKQRHVLYSTLCRQGPVTGIDPVSLSNISEVISNDDFCLKYKEIYDIFYSAK